MILVELRVARRRVCLEQFLATLYNDRGGCDAYSLRRPEAEGGGEGYAETNDRQPRANQCWITFSWAFSFPRTWAAWSIMSDN
jgi:hypothetical protein